MSLTDVETDLMIAKARIKELEKERETAEICGIMSRDDVLDKAKECVSGQRQQDYGAPEDNFSLIAKFWSAYRGIEFDAVDVAMMMSLLKIVRISSGHGTQDSFIDLAGYAACGGEIFTRGSEKKEI